MLSLSRSLSCLSYFGCQIDLSPSLSFLSLYFHCVLTLHPLCRMLSLPFFLAPKCSSIQLSPVFLISLFPLSVFCPSLVHHISTTLPLLSFTALSLARYFSHSINQTHSHLSHDMIPPTPPFIFTCVTWTAFGFRPPHCSTCVFGAARSSWK